MLRGFQLLKTRTLNEDLPINEIENEFGFQLPPLYKLFIRTFYTGKGSLHNEYFLNPERGEKYIFNAPLYEPLKDNEKWFLSISYFDTIEKVLNDWKSYLSYEKEWAEFKFIRIADIGQGGGLYVSNRPEDLDVIYQVVWDWEEPYFKVAENIFELVKGLVLPESSVMLPNNISTSQLYKQFGGDFWRIRE